MKRLALLGVGGVVLLAAACGSSGTSDAGGSGAGESSISDGVGTSAGGASTTSTGTRMTTSSTSSSMSTSTSTAQTTGSGAGDATSSTGPGAGTSVGGGSATGTGGGADHTPGFTTVFTIVMENHSEEDIVGSAAAPYINSLIAQYGFAANYYDSMEHPSLLNYLWLVSGSDQGAPTDVDPDWNWGFGSFPVTAPHLGQQLDDGNVKWRSYQESMGTPCKLDNDGNYAPRHDPFLYFSDIQDDVQKCSRLNVDYSVFPTDLAAGDYKYMWITPNLVDNGHNRDSTVDPSNSDDYAVEIEQEDAWLSTEIPKILQSATYQAGGVIFLTWDEGDSPDIFSTDDHVAMIVISPKLKQAGFVSNTPLSHASYLATMEDLWGFPRVGAAVGAQNMYEFFDF